MGQHTVQCSRISKWAAMLLCDILQRTELSRSNKLTTDKVCSVQTTVRNHDINDAVRMKHTTKDACYTGNSGVPRLEKSTSTQAAQQQQLRQKRWAELTQRAPVIRVTKLLQLTSNHKTKEYRIAAGQESGHMLSHADVASCKNRTHNIKTINENEKTF